MLSEYLYKHKWCAVSALLLTNICSVMYKLSMYRDLLGFISYVSPLINLQNYLVTFFIKLSVVHFSQTFIKYILEKIIIMGINDLFRKMINQIMNNNMDYYKKDISGKINQIWTYLNNIESIICKLLIDLPVAVTFIVYYLYLIYTLYQKSMLFIIPANLFIIFAIYPFSRRKHKLQRDRTNQDTYTKHKLLEAVTNIEFVKLNNHEDHEIQKICDAHVNSTYNKIDEKWINLCIDFISYIYNDFILLVVYIIGVIHVINNLLSPVDLLYLVLNTTNFYYQIMQLKDIYNYYMKIDPSIELFNTLLNDNKMDTIIRKTKEDKGINRNNIVFKNITFSYNGIQNVINDISFEFIGNKINLLLGPNGSGKSTLIKLLLRLYDLDNDDDDNKIYFKGRNIKNLSLQELRNRIAFVSQEPHIFNDTVLYNIKYGNETVSDAKIAELCDILYSRDWLLQNRNKPTGFRGRNLSGGERKKIQLINVICKNAEVIIFDEPTNTLDSNALIWFNEFVQLLRDQYNKTIVIITHDIRLREVGDHITDLSKLN